MKPEVADAINSIMVNMNEGGMNALNIVLAFVMFGVALGIKPRTFVEIAKNPKSVILGAICQMIFLPALTFLLAISFTGWISPMIGLGMILVAACPGGNISNFMTSLSKGNVELSVSLTAVSTGFSIFATPINFAFWGNMYLNFIGNRQVLPELSIPFWEVFKTIVILLGIPLVLGVLCSQYLPKVAQKLKKPMSYLSIAFFVAMVIIMFYNNFDNFMKCINYIFFVVLLHNLLALLIGFSTGTFFKVPRKDRRTLTVETGIQNSGLGLVLLLNTNIFPAEIWHGQYGGMLVIAAWWGIWHIISGLTVSYLFNRSKLPQDQQ